MPNRLAKETSPYLLQHANNPVDWHAWNDEALQKARGENKPILLSIGYSACHWCHVMEHESFENPEIAALMNQHFINIKVDREERPDLDQVYMSAVQIMTGSGGWPLTVFLLPTGEPFYGGTYFPPEDRYGRPGFPRLLAGIADAFRTRHDDVTGSAARLRETLNRKVPGSAGSLTIDTTVLDSAVHALASRFDPSEGGFGSAPKFPPSMAIDLLLQYCQRTGDPQAAHMVTLTLDRMAAGGLYDQIGGGFHRYSTDDRWLVPHFEKMLYDNALLARTYLDAYRLTGQRRYRTITEQVLDFIVREMRAANGGFYASQDADSEGVEGKFYVWTREEFDHILGPDAALMARYLDVRPHGNWEHHTILNVPYPAEDFCRVEQITLAQLQSILADARTKLYAAREKRIRPNRDEKILTDWNGLALRAFADAAAYLGREDYRKVAEDNAEFLFATLWDGTRLLHSFKDGRARFNGYLDDYANVADGLLALYQLTFNPVWLQRAAGLADRIVDQFADHEHGGFYFTARDHETLISRRKDFFDGATPSGNSVAANVMLRLAVLLERNDLRQYAERLFASIADLFEQYSSGFGRMLCAVDFYLGPSREIAISGDPQAFAAVFRKHYLPRTVIAAGEPDSTPLLRHRPMVEGRPTAYVCENNTCNQPVTDCQAFEEQLLA